MGKGNCQRKDISEIMLTEEQIKARVAELGEQISKDYEGQSLVAICMLKGGVVFFADMVRAIDIPVEFEFMVASSYGESAVSSGVVNIGLDIKSDISGKNVLIIEDIIDSGNTLDCVMKILKDREPASLEACCLLNKPDRREIDVPIKYIGFDIPDEFVVGYGLDYDSRYRNFSEVGILAREVYSD